MRDLQMSNRLMEHHLRALAFLNGEAKDFTDKLNRRREAQRKATSALRHLKASLRDGPSSI